ncbi:hypothetical protein NL676_023778 [Syzygium grande]|nr:hypothetical protein NL676_023778 [Syzygium grande]
MPPVAGQRRTENTRAKRRTCKIFIVSDQEDSLASGPRSDASIHGSPPPIAEDFHIFFRLLATIDKKKPKQSSIFGQTKLTAVEPALFAPVSEPRSPKCSALARHSPANADLHLRCVWDLQSDFLIG